jgi:hypothetical protein
MKRIFAQTMPALTGSAMDSSSNSGKRRRRTSNT